MKQNKQNSKSDGPTILRLPTRTPPQKRISESKSRFNIAAWGRQSGKTTFGTWRMAQVLSGPENAIYWYVLQTYSAAEIAYNRFVQLFPRDHRSVFFDKKPNESEKCVYLKGNRQVHFKSGDNFEDLRAETLHGVIIDECRQQDSRLWKQVIRPMLAKHKGWAYFFSTPNGFDWFYDLAEKAKIDSDWSVFHAPSSEAWWWTREELESAKREMTEDEYAQEILAEFRDLTRGKAYKNYGDHNIRRENPLAPPGHRINQYLPIHVGLDFNLSPMSWSLAQKKGNNLHFFDEVFLPKSDTVEAAKVLVEKVRGHALGVVLVGDATGKAGQRAAAGKSDYDILCQVLDDAGINWINLTPTQNPRIKDRVNTVNARLKSASGEVFVTVDDINCPYLHKDFQRVAWKERNEGVMLDQKTDPMLTHMSDGAGYLICQVLPIDSASEQVGTLQVIRR